MTDAVALSIAQMPTIPRGVNLDAVERAMRDASGTDLTEVKEALVEALLQLAVQNAQAKATRESLFSALSLQQRW